MTSRSLLYRAYHTPGSLLLIEVAVSLVCGLVGSYLSRNADMSHPLFFMSLYLPVPPSPILRLCVHHLFFSFYVFLLYLFAQHFLLFLLNFCLSQSDLHSVR